MENNTLFSIIQEGYRTAIGATTSAVETLQDNQKRSQVLSDLNAQWQQKSKEWEEKGTITEQEAKKIIEQFFNGVKFDSNKSYQDIEINSGNKKNDDIQELTKEVISLREELEKLNLSR